jgi:two-component system, chemotaxis family, CheB/CheR fusion protein
LAEANPGLERVLEYLNQTRAFDFTGYRRATLDRRVRHRMQRVGIEDHDRYVDYLEVHPDEFAELFNAILINVSAFFRDPDTWEFLRSDVVPRLLSDRPEGSIRIWSAGCANGREAYSAVMLFAEAIGVDAVKERVKVYATDIDSDALDQARQAVYSAKEIEGLPDELLHKYFTLNGHGYSFSSDLRRTVIFGRHDLLKDAPISRVDLLLCRNTLMYFNRAVQDDVINRLHYSLAEHGTLVLGKVEMLVGHSELFEPIDSRRRVFTKRPSGSLRSRLLAMAGRNTVPPASGDLVANLSFENRSNPEVLLDATLRLVGANAAARRIFRIPMEALGQPFQDLEMSYRPVELRSTIDQARDENRTVSLMAVGIAQTAGDTAYYDIDVVPLNAEHDDDEFLGVLVSFTDVTHHRLVQDELEQTHRELETAYEELQSANEELETTNEELQSTIEELETTNEELQSTNEELETTNEELSSTNEELETINDELRERTNELNQVSSYMESILTSLDVGVVVTDRDLMVRVWNGKSLDLWGLRSDEVEGRSLLSLNIGFPVETLGGPARRCLSTWEPQEPFVVPAISRRGQPLTCRVRMTPLVGTQTAVEGVIILIDARQGTE